MPNFINYDIFIRSHYHKKPFCAGKIKDAYSNNNNMHVGI